MELDEMNRLELKAFLVTLLELIRKSSKEEIEKFLENLIKSL